MTEGLKQKAEDFIDRINKESDGMWLNNYYLSDLLVMFATEATKELQETNNELEGKLVLSDMVLTDKTKRIKELEDKLMDKVCLESLDIVSAKIKDLEKENAELKARLNAINLLTPELEKKSKLRRQQLTKAKEIIKDLLNLPFASNEEVFADVGSHLDKAEQFLKESE